MADVVDITQDRVDIYVRDAMRNAGYDEYKPLELAKGQPGECEMCGEESQRLIKGACAPCRDKYHLR